MGLEQMSNYVLYGTPISPFVRKVEVLLRAGGVSYDFESIDIFQMPDWFLEISPARRVPVLRDRSVSVDGVAGTISDSSAICIYLDRKLNAGWFGDNAFDAGRIASLEEYADTELAQPLGMRVFRPILLPRIAGQDSDVGTASRVFKDELPRHLDYLEETLGNKDFFVGERMSLADIAIGAQLTQLDLVVSTPYDVRWPGLARHTQTMKAHAGFVDNLATCRKVLSRLVPQKVDLT